MPDTMQQQSGLHIGVLQFVLPHPVLKRHPVFRPADPSAEKGCSVYAVSIPGPETGSEMAESRQKPGTETRSREESKQP